MAVSITGHSAININRHSQRGLCSERLGMIAKTAQAESTSVAVHHRLHEKFPAALRPDAPVIDAKRRSSAESELAGVIYGPRRASTLLIPTITGRGNLALAGLADSSTRLIALISNIPAGVTLTAP